MFEDRKSVFVDLLKWDVPVLDGRFELDQFDDEHATYIIVADESGDHLGSARLLPTDAPAHPRLALSASSAPDRRQRARRCSRSRASACRAGRCRVARRETRNRLVSALAWHALETRDPHLYRRRRNRAGSSRSSRSAGTAGRSASARRSSCGMIGALAIEIDADTPALLAANGIWDLADAQPTSAIAASRLTEGRA